MSLRERHRQQTSERVLDAAEQVYLARGAHSATLEEIAASAEVSIQTIYNYFGGKRGLYLAAVERAARLNSAYMDDAYREELRPVEQIAAATDAYLRFHLEHPGCFQMIAMPHLAGPAGEDDPEVAERIAAIVEQEGARLTKCLKRAVAAGDIEGSPAELAMFLWGAWNGVIALAHRPDRLRRTDAEIERILASGRALMLSGIGRTPKLTTRKSVKP